MSATTKLVFEKQIYGFVEISFFRQALSETVG